MSLLERFAQTKERVGRALLGEQAQIEGASYKSSFYNWPAVSDDLLAAKGSAASVYRKMRFDPEIKTALTIVIGGLFARGWKILPAVNEQDEYYTEALKQSNYAQWSFDNMQGSLDDVIEECLIDSFCYGIAVPEKVWVLVENDEYIGNITYKAIKPKDPSLFNFAIDPYGNPTSLVQQVDGQIINCDLDKFAILRINSEHGNPNGVSELRGAHKFWWMKDNMLKFWAVFLEKYGAPTAVGTCKRGTPKAAQDHLKSVLDKIQQETAIVIPDDITVDLLEAARSGDTSGFERLINYCDKQLVKSLLGQTLTTDEGRRSGSFALGAVHEAVQTIIINRIRRKAEEWMDESIIRPLIDYNFAERHYPNFVLPLDQKDVASLSEAIFRLVSCEVVDPRESWTREYLGLPTREDLPPMPEPAAATEPPTTPVSPRTQEAQTKGV